MRHPTPWRTEQFTLDKQFCSVKDNNNISVIGHLLDKDTANLIVEAVNTREKAKEYVKAMHPLVDQS